MLAGGVRGARDGFGQVGHCVVSHVAHRGEEACSPLASDGVCAASHVKMRARWGKAGRSARALRCERLKNGHRGSLETKRAACQIGEPQPGLYTANLTLRGLAVCIQAVMPKASRAGIVLAPAFHIMHLKSVPLEICDRHGEMVDVSAWEDVALKCRMLGCFLAKALVVARWMSRNGVI